MTARRKTKRERGREAAIMAVLPEEMGWSPF
jgi:hypothetical protein